MSIIDDIEDFLKVHDMSPTHFGVICLNDRSLVPNIRKGRKLHETTKQKVLNWMDQYKENLNSQTFTLPIPPSVNSLYRNVPNVGRVKTGTYKKWLEEAGWLLKSQRVRPFTGEVILDIKVERPKNKDGTVSKRKRDLSNTLKALEDLLVHHRIIEDDSLIVSISASWSTAHTGAVVTIYRTEEKK